MNQLNAPPIVPLPSSANQHARPHAKSRSGYFRFVILLVAGLVLVLNYVDRVAIGIVGPLIQKEFGFDLATFGFIIGAFAFAYAPACFLGGWAADKFGPRKVMMWAVTWWSLLTATTAACSSVLTFTLQRIGFGLGEGPMGSTTAKTLSNWFPKKEFGTATGLVFAFNPLGAALGAPIVVALLAMGNNNWRVPFLGLGAVGLCIALIWWLVVRDRPAQHPMVTPAEVLHITSDAAPDEHASGTDDPSVPPLAYYLRQPAVLGNGLAFFSYAYVLYMFLSWYPQYLTEAFGISLTNIAWAASVPWVMAAAGNFFGGVVSDFVANRSSNPFKARKVIASIALAGAGISVIPMTMAGNTLESVVLLSIALFLLYIANTQFFALVREAVHPKRLGSVTGFVHFLANCASFIAPVLTGFLVQKLHSWPLAFGIATGLALAGALALALVRRPKLTAIGADA